MRIIAFGDIHMELGSFQAIPGIETADLLLITGDFTNYGGKEEVKQVLDRVLAVNDSVLALAGNLDDPSVGGYLADLDLSLHGRGREVNGLGLFGVGGSNITPFNTPNEYTEDEIAAFLKAGYREIEHTRYQIMISHTPPVDTVTDLISNGMHVGSPAVRTFIEETQPALCVTGHIHEAHGEDRLGATHVLNPGMIKDGGYIEIGFENGRLRASLWKET